MTNILFVGDSFFVRSYKDNRVNLVLNGMGFTSVYTCIMEGKGIVSYNTNKECYAKIAVALGQRKYDYIFVNGSIGGSGTNWNKQCVSLIRKIKQKQPKAKIYLVATMHINQKTKKEYSWSWIKSCYDNAAKKAGCGVVYVGKYYAGLNKKYPKLKMTDTDKRHPAYISYWMMGCCIYSLINNKKAPHNLGDYKNAYPNPNATKKCIADLVWKDYIPSVPTPTYTCKFKTSGQVTALTTVNVREAPNTTAKIVAKYSKGMKLNYQSVAKAVVGNNTYFFAVYKGGSGKIRYTCLQKNNEVYWK